MWKFLATFLALYSFTHVLFFFRARVLLPDQRFAQGLFIFFLILMILAPIASYPLEKNGQELLARSMAFIGFSWMGFIFLAFWFCLFMVVFDLFSWVVNTVTSIHLPSLTGKVPVLLMLGLTGALCCSGFFAAHDLRIKHLRIETTKLPRETNHLKIAQISDIHAGLLAGKDNLKTLVEKLKQEAPDLLVCTGDLIDSNPAYLTEVSKALQQIHPPYGKYAVTGNHEYYAGIEEALPFLQSAGFRVLRGEAETINPLINIVGIDDHAVNNGEEQMRLLASVHNGLFTLFLKHRPVVLKETLGLFDLQLSGHTHGGQIFPFHYFVSLHFPFFAGFYELEKGSKLYTSRGSGTWGPRMRILAPPEITIIEITRNHESL